MDCFAIRNADRAIAGMARCACKLVHKDFKILARFAKNPQPTDVVQVMSSGTRTNATGKTLRDANKTELCFIQDADRVSKVPGRIYAVRFVQTDFRIQEPAALRDHMGEEWEKLLPVQADIIRKICSVIRRALRAVMEWVRFAGSNVQIFIR